MKRTAIFVVAALVMTMSWSVGRAQTRLATFEINFDTSRGPVKVTCVRGCDWPANDGTLVCDTERCRFMFNEHGRILQGQPR
jgi:hypothetical protein